MKSHHVALRDRCDRRTSYGQPGRFRGPHTVAGGNCALSGAGADRMWSK